MHAASVVNRVRKGDKGFAAYWRWKEREFTKPVHAPTLSVGDGKFDVRWKEGIWWGIKAGRGESLIEAGEGVVKARDFIQKETRERRPLE